MEDFESLTEQLQSANSTLVEKAISSLVHLQDKRAIPYLLSLLSSTDDTIIRNSAALALGDMRANEAVTALIKLINDPKNINKRGTLIYALQSLDCSKVIKDVVKIICDGNFECREMALQIIEEMNLKDKPLNIEESLTILFDCAKNRSPSDPAIDYINRAIDILEHYK